MPKVTNKSALGIATIAVVSAGALFFPGVLHGGGSQSTITIQSDSDFLSCRCVSSGTGAKTDPYVIGPLAINSVSGTGVSIDGTNLTKSFRLFNLTIAGKSAATSTGIFLNHINPSGTQDIEAEVTGGQTSIQTVGVGITVENSSYVTLDGGGANPNAPGVMNHGAGTINKAVSGSIDVENSSHITVRGWQMSASGASPQPNWITLDPGVQYWGVGGVRLFGVTQSTLDHNAANNSTSVSFSLFNSSNNVVSNNTADYPFTTNLLITDGSSYNLVTGNQFTTGDFFNYLVADPLPGSSTLSTYGPSHDNVLTGNFSGVSGPTGTEIHSSTAPAFQGGVIVLNGTYNNQITNNTIIGNLGWAQAVPDASTPIGVVAYPPVLHCNVTASEGGGGVGNQNGNVWSGNVGFHAIDPCVPEL
jgi:parallel beta-helix repeat protein